MLELIITPWALLAVCQILLSTCSAFELERTNYDNCSEIVELIPSNHRLPINIQNYTTENLSSKTLDSTEDGRMSALDFGRTLHEQYNDHSAELVYQFFKNPNHFNGRYTIYELELIALSARSQWLVYGDTPMHRYDSYAMLRQSTGPHVDQELCLKQLEHLDRRLFNLEQNKFNSTDLNLYHLLDVYGRVSPGLTAGNLIWPGMYEECLILKIESPEGSLATRYCLASIKTHGEWSGGNKLGGGSANFEMGVCLPRACDSLRYKNKYQLIQRLVDFNARQVDKSHRSLVNLYCLPDRDSPMRMWWRLPSTLQAVVVLATWIAVLIYATIKYEQLKKWDESYDKLQPHPAGVSPKLDRSGAGSCDNNEITFLWLYRMLAVTRNFRLLFDTTPKRVGNSIEPTVDLRCLEGIKVICMCYVIMGHVLMCIAMSNVREMTYSLSPAYIVANMMPAFAVNAFFTITGLLTCYLTFKHNQAHLITGRPSRYTAFILHRYLRIMPVYVVVVYYCKYISKFTGSGPMWDYGTSSATQRHRCEQESWLWTLLFGANFKPVFDQCIPSAWYLANDFQFFLITPIFLAILHKRPAFGQSLLKLCAALGYLAGILSMISADSLDSRPIVNFMPHGFKSYVTFLSPSYTRPYYRIPAYLCGLLLGYQLHVYELRKLEHRSHQPTNSRDPNQSDGTPDEPQWSARFVNYGTKVSMFCVLLCALVPIIGSQIASNKFFATLLVALFMSSYHVIFSLAVGLYILLATTGHGNKFINQFLSGSFWKPLSRLNLCVVLINIEVINYIMQTQKQPVYLDFFSHSSLNLLAIGTIYLVASFVFVLFEAPIKAALNRLLKQASQMIAQKRKLQ